MNKLQQLLIFNGIASRNKGLVSRDQLEKAGLTKHLGDLETAWLILFGYGEQAYRLTTKGSDLIDSHLIGDPERLLINGAIARNPNMETPEEAHDALEYVAGTTRYDHVVRHYNNIELGKPFEAFLKRVLKEADRSRAIATNMPSIEKQLIEAAAALYPSYVYILDSNLNRAHEAIINVSSLPLKNWYLSLSDMRKEDIQCNVVLAAKEAK